ncbi:MAG TPA: MFS transporter [Beijerinckiaceae bacterium]|nr:MFS transporter [Beijerinckiaceae bacterium]
MKDSGKTGEPSGGWAVFAEPDFRAFALARLMSGMAQNIQTVGVGLYVYQVTRDPLALGLAGLFTFLPQLMFVALSGHAADSFDRRRIVAAGYALAAVSGVGLMLIAGWGLTATAPVYAMITLMGTTQAFVLPANQAMLPNLVRPGWQASAVAWNASIRQAATILGPMAGGFLYLLGPLATFAVACLCNLLGVAAALTITPQRSPARREAFSFSAFTTGARFITANKVLLGALSLDLVAVLFAGVVALLPIYATDILEAGPAALGWLRASQAAGALGMALFLARYPIRRHGGRWMLTASAVFGLAIIGFGLSRLLWLSMLMMMIEGAADMVSVVVRGTLVQAETPDDMRGRVGSVNSLFIGASNSLGDFESGLVAAWIGVVPATIVGGCLSLMATALWCVLFPELRKRDRLQKG